MGYVLVEENEDFFLLRHKGDDHVLAKQGCRDLYVDDPNDAAIFKILSRLQATPAPDDAKRARRTSALIRQPDET